MLTDFVSPTKPDKKALKAELKTERQKLSDLQLKIKTAKLPVIVIFEGWGAAGKGSVLGRVINNIDPRFMNTATYTQTLTAEEKRKPFGYRYLSQIPEAGKFQFYDTCWMEEVTAAAYKNPEDLKTYEHHIAVINTAERQLHDNGYLIVKCFFNISKKAQKKRLKNLAENPSTRWRVTKIDCEENRHYTAWRGIYDRYLKDTNQAIAPWFIIDAKHFKWAELQVLQILNQSIETALSNQALAAPIIQNVYALKPIPKLADVPLDRVVSKKYYKERLAQLSARLRMLHYECYKRKIPVIIGYEGWDAAGKGGNIKRVAAALDPRGYTVVPVASPEPHEKARHYLWRFLTQLPKTGHVAIFDRTWYGRVMVERIEGFCSENDWRRAYNEINEFERGLTDWGAVLLKFWVQIDADTQLERFKARENTPDKQWKITDEDWRNRDKWDIYETAVNEMLAKTNTDFAPWHILPSVDKRAARIQALSIVVAALEEACQK